MPIISFRFALDNMVRNISKFAIFVIMMIVCLVMILLLQLIYKGETYSYNELDKLLSEGVAGTGVLRFTSDRYFSEIGYEFLRESEASDKIGSIGSVTFGSTSGLEDLLEIQKKYMSEIESEIYGGPDILYLNSTGFQLCDLKLSEGVLPLDLEVKKVGTYIYLGSDFKEDISLGKIYQAGEMTYEVAGFFEEGSKYLQSGFGATVDPQALDYSVELDSMVVLVEYIPGTNNMIFNVEDKTGMNDAVKELKSIAETYGLEIVVQSIDDIIEERNVDILLMRSYLQRVLWLVLFCSVVLMSCLQMNNVISNKRSYGVYYAMGFSKNNILGMLLAEAFIKTLTAFAVSCIVGIFVAQKWFYGVPFAGVLNELYWKDVVPEVFISAIVIMFFSTVAPMIALYRYTPVELIGGKND